MGRWLGFVAMLAVGCYAPSIEPCHYACAGQSCPAGLVCSNEGMCAETKTQICGGDGDGGTGDADADTGPRNYAFVTSRSDIVPKNLADLAAADAVCDGLAAAAGKPGTYRAWISTASSDAIDRLAGASGWVRADGTPFANTPGDIAAGRLYYPLRLDENGIDVFTNMPGYVATGTAENGRRQTGSTDCLGGGTQVMTYGSVDATTHYWTEDGIVACTVASRLYCFQVDHQAVVSDPAPTGRRAFLSTGLTNAANGVAALDAVCAGEAMNPNVIALVATTTMSALDRLAPGTPWVRPDGAVFLTGARVLKAPLNVSRDKTYFDDDLAWSGALAIDALSSTTTGENCSNWTVVSQSARVGRVARSSRTLGFGSTNASSCSGLLRLYCVER